MDTARGPDPGDGGSGPIGSGGDGADGPVDGRWSDGDDRDVERADGGEEGLDDPDPHDPLRFHHWMKRSATGAVLTGIALGLQEALEGRREQPAFVMEAPGEPEDPDAPITLHFDPDDPTRTVAVVRDRSPTPDAPDTGG